MEGSTIVNVTARQVFSGRGHPAVEASVFTANGAVGTAQCTAGVSVGTHEVAFTYDGGPLWHGKGVTRAVANVNRVICPALKGLDAADQSMVDRAMLALENGDSKRVLGGNAVAAVSAAALKAGARALDIPLYRHIGGDRAVTLPCASHGAVIGSNRYSPNACNKPTYSWIAYGFPSFAEACYAIWRLSARWENLLNSNWGLMARLPCPDFPSGGFTYIPDGIVSSDAEIWDMMAENICACGYEGRAGIHVDIAADSYFDRATRRYRGLFDSKTRTREELMGYLVEICHTYPFVSYEDPLNEDDYEGHAVLTERTGIQIVGDDLFTTNAERVRAGIAHGSCNAVLLKVNQIGTITEALSMVRLAYENGYGVMPCSSRGEDLAICDYSVGMNVTTIRENCFGTGANRFLEIERELGSRAVFAGKAGLKGRRFSGRTEEV